MFRDDRQICDALRVLLSSLHLEHLWTHSGPTERALELLEHRGEPMSHGEALLVLAAFDFCNRQGKTDFGQLLSVLNDKRMTLVASLMIASSEGPTAVDRWIGQQTPHMPRAKPAEHDAACGAASHEGANGRTF